MELHYFTVNKTSRIGRIEQNSSVAVLRLLLESKTGREQVLATTLAGELHRICTTVPSRVNLCSLAAILVLLARVSARMKCDRDTNCVQGHVSPLNQ